MLKISNFSKNAPTKISNAFAIATAALGTVIAIAPKVTDVLAQANCTDGVNVGTKVVAVATTVLGILKAFTAEKETGVIRGANGRFTKVEK